VDIIDRHFDAENNHDVLATLQTYAEDVVWDDVANPSCPVQGKEATALMYEGILAAIPDLHLESTPRGSLAAIMWWTSLKSPVMSMDHSLVLPAAVRPLVSVFFTFSIFEMGS
jgi:hypothetical protein